MQQLARSKQKKQITSFAMPASKKGVGAEKYAEAKDQQA